jgi:translocator protein
MSLHDVLGFMTFIVACAAAAAPGMKFQPGEWYAALRKPAWTPPDWVFPVVWTVLYFMIAIAGWLVWTGAGSDGAALPLAVFGLQLVFNGFWSVLFFGLRLPGYAFADLVLLWLTILATVLLFLPLQPVAAWLLVPYLLWVGYAGALNFTIWRLNMPERSAR